MRATRLPNVAPVPLRTSLARGLAALPRRVPCGKYHVSGEGLTETSCAGKRPFTDRQHDVAVMSAFRTRLAEFASVGGTQAVTTRTPQELFVLLVPTIVVFAMTVF